MRENTCASRYDVKNYLITHTHMYVQLILYTRTRKKYYNCTYLKIHFIKKWVSSTPVSYTQIPYDTRARSKCLKRELMSSSPTSFHKKMLLAKTYNSLVPFTHLAKNLVSNTSWPSLSNIAYFTTILPNPNTIRIKHSRQLTPHQIQLSDIIILTRCRIVQLQCQTPLPDWVLSILLNTRSVKLLRSRI